MQKSVTLPDIGEEVWRANGTAYGARSYLGLFEQALASYFVIYILWVCVVNFEQRIVALFFID